MQELKPSELALAVLAGFGMGLWTLPLALLALKLIGDLLP
jgi:hypothetical protein